MTYLARAHQKMRLWTLSMLVDRACTVLCNYSTVQRWGTQSSLTRYSSEPRNLHAQISTPIILSLAWPSILCHLRKVLCEEGYEAWSMPSNIKYRITNIEHRTSKIENAYQCCRITVCNCPSRRAKGVFQQPPSHLRGLLTPFEAACHQNTTTMLHLPTLFHRHATDYLVLLTNSLKPLPIVKLPDRTPTDSII